MATAGEKDPGALLTIGELSQELGVAQHILRYWETRFAQLKPMQRAGNRRYYRPADVELARRINRLLNQEGYTVRGVQKLLRDRADRQSETASVAPEPARESGGTPTLENASAEQATEEREGANRQSGIDVGRLIALRNRLADALES